MRVRRRASPQRSNETERLLRSSRVQDEVVPVLSPGVGARRAEEAVRQAGRRLSEAQRLLNAYRNSSESELGAAYGAVHAAKGDLAAARHWRALEAMVADSTRR